MEPAGSREPAATWSATWSVARESPAADRLARRLSPRDCAFRPLLVRFSFGLGWYCIIRDTHEGSVASLSLRLVEK